MEAERDPGQRTMRFQFVVTVDVERKPGNTTSRYHIAEDITEALESADKDVFLSDNAYYDVTDWSVEEQDARTRQ